MRRGKTFIICGPSGVGKGTVVARLLASDPTLYFSVSATTRPPREGEVDGVHYHFIPAEEFHRMVEEDEFLEYAEYVGNFYGTPKKYVDRAMDDGRDVILDIEIQGANQICAKRPETVRIFIAPPSWVELERRLTARGTDSQEVIQSRLLRAKVELQTASSYDYLVINDTVEQAVAEATMPQVTVRPIEPQGKLIGFASVNIGGVVVDDFKVVDGKNGVFLGAPSKPDPTSRTGYRTTARVTNRDLQAQLDRAAAQGYNQAVEKLLARAEAVRPASIREQMAQAAKEAGKENAARPAPAKGKEARDDR